MDNNNYAYKKLSQFKKKVEYLENVYRDKLAETNKKMQIEDRINKKLDYLNKISKEKFEIFCDDDKKFITSKDIILNCKLSNNIQKCLQQKPEIENYFIDFSKKLFKYLFEIMIRCASTYEKHMVVYIKKKDKIVIPLLISEAKKFFLLESEFEKEFMDNLIFFNEADSLPYNLYKNERKERETYNTSTNTNDTKNILKSKDIEITMAKKEMDDKLNNNTSQNINFTEIEEDFYKEPEIKIVLNGTKTKKRKPKKKKEKEKEKIQIIPQSYDSIN